MALTLPRPRLADASSCDRFRSTAVPRREGCLGSRGRVLGEEEWMGSSGLMMGTEGSMWVVGSGGR
eukprot:2659292-Rhodomonas_salina.4